MNQMWKHLKRWGLPLLARIGLAMPLLLGLGAALMLVAIWWLGPQWVWREQQPLASVAHRGLASLALVSATLHDLVEMLDDARRHERVAVVVEVEPPRIARAFGEYLECVRGRMESPDARIELDAFGIWRAGSADIRLRKHAVGSV